MVPLVRSFISIPAGVTRMDMRTFLFFTFLGSTIWAALLAFAGYKLGENWEDLRAWLGPADIVVAIGLVVFLAWYIWRQVKESWEAPKNIGT
jgi:membrane protein DedA with SNARE-associated domain